ncbi:diguanylate cyclase [Sphingomonas sp. LY160]|uniref:sensor domain-containing diguanylate cyclase n=1 Tax=Sphingomonas sp. LY160 TaxID=3095342 RepID=UPI002ADED910|nr:diguanylate cyclase [Sphingomonas sp. LY160]MEA1071500.1 diguanylate cyclase [Sphingomonas sp. LY160]
MSSHSETVFFPRSFRAPLSIGFAYFLAASATVALTRFDGGVAFLWLASSLLIAHLVISPRRHWRSSIAAAAIGSLLATGLFGLGWTLAIPFMVINMTEAVLAAAALRRSRHRTHPLGSLAWLAQFLFAVAVAGPLIAAAMAGTVMAAMGNDSLSTFFTFWTGHALGNITFTPLMLLAFRGDLAKAFARIKARDAVEIAALILVGSAIAFMVFAQEQLPLLFLPILPIMLATFRLGRGGAAAGIVILALIGGALTAAGQGPIQLIVADAGSRMLFFQAYVAATVLTVLPVAADLSRRARLLREVRLNGDRFRLLADHSTDILMHLDLDGRILFVSPSVRQLGGYDPSALLGQNSRVLIAPTHRSAVEQAHLATIAAAGATHSFEYLALTADGDERWFETRARAITDDDGEVEGVLAIVRDVSARKATEARLSEAAMTDPLTGLANRRAFKALVEERRAERTPLDALAIIDIDHFKRVNDRYGHDTGDEVLRALSRVARRMLRHGDVIARIGGEEFALLFPDSSIEQAMLVCDRLRAEVAGSSIRVGGTKLEVTISGGVAMIDERGLDHAYKVADAALYRAKEEGRDRFLLAA